MPPAPPVRASVVVAVRDEAATIGPLITSLRRQTRRADEVIFVDGGSTDETVSIVERLIACDANFRLVRAESATPGRGRNIGIEEARNEWVALTDAGIELDDHWLERLVRVVEHDPDVDVVYGSFEPAARTFFERCAGIAYVQGARPSPRGPVRGGSVASVLLRKEAWRGAGGFPDLRAAEDAIFVRALHARGVKVGSAPEARVTWQLQPGLRATFTRFRSYSRHNVLAGEQRHWHHGVARIYAAGLAPVVLGVVHRRGWFAVTLAAAMARVGRTLWRRREGRGVGWVLRPDRFGLVGVILAVVDAATFLGWAEGAVARRRQGRR